MFGKLSTKLRGFSLQEIFASLGHYLAAFGAWIFSLIGALGIALQNYLGLIALLQSIGHGAMTATKAGIGIAQTLGILLGGVCGGVVNLFINLPLLKSFIGRFTGAKPKPEFASNAERAKYWLGIAVFIVTGLLYGAMAFSFGAIGALAMLGIVAGAFVAVISTIQEMETWLEKFDKADPLKPADPTGTRTSRVIGKTLSIGAIIALSLLFTMGLASFLSGVGVPMIPALVVGGALSFSAGLFTEYTFYNKFITNFCNNVSEKWKNFKASRLPVLGGIIAVLNGTVNAALAYVAITMLFGLLVGAGVAAPPLGAVMAVGIVVALFAGVASTLLGMDFWISNMKKKPVVDEAADSEQKNDSCAHEREHDREQDDEHAKLLGNEPCLTAVAENAKDNEQTKNQNPPSSKKPATKDNMASLQNNPFTHFQPASLRQKPEARNQHAPRRFVAA